MALKKPSDFFGKVVEESNLLVIEDDNSLREELSKVESLSEQVIELKKELSQKVIKNDLESIVYSQINLMHENFDLLQTEIKKSNREDIGQFKIIVDEVTNIVENLVENEIPKYRKQVLEKNIAITERFNSFKETIEENVVDIKEEIENRVDIIATVVDDNVEYFNRQLLENGAEINKTVNTFNKLSKIVENKITKENETLEKYSNSIKSLYEQFKEFKNSFQEQFEISQKIVEEKVLEYGEDFNNYKKDLNQTNARFFDVIEVKIEDYRKDLSDVKSDVLVNEHHLKKIDEFVNENHQELVELKEEVFSEIENLPFGNIQENIERLEKKIDFIKETYSKIEPEIVVKEVIKEGLLNNPSEKNSDPLTPTDKNFVTLEQLQQHYRLFINRIQQQLSTLGGGGETRLKYLDDVVGIATNPSVYDGKYLKYNHSIGKFEFDGVIGGSSGTVSGIGSFTELVVSGITTLGVTTFTGYVSLGNSAYFADNNVLYFGDGEDLKIFHDGNHSIIQDNGVGNLYILASNQLALQSNSSENYLIGNSNGSVELYYDNLKRFETMLTGSQAFGAVYAGPSGSGGIHVSLGGDSGRNIDIGAGSTDSATYIDFYGTLTYSDYSSRIIRDSGDNSSLNIINRGTGSIRIVSQDSGAIDFVTKNIYRHRINSDGIILVGTATSTGSQSQLLQVNSGAYIKDSVGIGTTVSNAKLTVNGDSLIVGVVTATDFNSASDIKLKENVSIIETPLDKVIKLQGVNFQWKVDGRKSLGVIAQEVEKVLPELVSGGDTKTVNYNGIIGLLIECVKEQQKEIDELKKHINK